MAKLIPTKRGDYTAAVGGTAACFALSSLQTILIFNFWSNQAGTSNKCGIEQYCRQNASSFDNFELEQFPALAVCARETAEYALVTWPVKELQALFPYSKTKYALWGGNKHPWRPKEPWTKGPPG